MKRKITAMITAVLMVFTVCIIPADTVSAYSSTDTKWTDGVEGGAIYFDEATGTITDCDTGVKRANIPEKINGVTVKFIGIEAFEDCESLISVKIPNSVNGIEDYAFHGCQTLPSITIPDSVTSIGNQAFDSCNSFKSVTIPNSVMSIGDNAFRRCESLTSIAVDDNNKNYSSRDGILYDKKQTKLIQYPTGNSRKSFTIPSSVTNIGEFAFDNCRSLTSITIPDNVTSIGGGAFYYCEALTSIVIPSSVTSIEDSTFDGCTSLTSIKIPGSVTSIGVYAFNSCYSLTSIKIPSSVTSIGDYALDCSSLTSITVDDNNKYYSSKDGVLYNKAQTKLIQYPLGNTREHFTIPSSVKSIGDNACWDCDHLMGLTIPRSVTSIGEYAFYSCDGLTSIKIPSSVKSIGKYAFSCYHLTSITIPNSVTNIGEGAFDDCNKLTISGYEGSYAETYAKNNGIPFKVLVSYASVDDIKVSTRIDTNTKSIQLFEGASGSVGDKPIAKVFPGDYSLNFPYIKTKVVKESNRDGTYKLKMSIGVNDNIVFGSKKGWDKLKKDVKEAKANLNDTASIAALVRKWGSGSANFNITKKFKKKPEMDVIGYYELTFDENGKIISDAGGMIVKAKWKASVTQQCVLAPIPIPFYVELGGNLSAKAKGEIEQAFSDMIPKFNGKLNICPEIYAGAGLGISGVATVGVRGKGGVDIQVAPPSKGDFTAELLVTAKVLFVFDGEVSIAKATYPLWDITKKSASVQALGSSDEQIEKFSLELTDRGYQNKTTEWLGAGSKNERRLGASADNENANQGITFNALQEYVMPNTIPQMKKAGSDTVMVFQSNDSSRDTINSSKLMYSIYNGSSWSEPEALWDNGTLDTFADLEVVGDELYVTWQKCNKEITQTDDVDAMGKELVSSSEICVSKYNGSNKAFEKPVQITDNAINDFIPVLANGSTEPAVMWVSSDSDDITCKEGNKEINLSKYTAEGWSEPEALGSTEEFIAELAGAYADNEYKAAFISIDSDNKQKLCSATGSVVTLVEPSDNTIASVKCSGGNIIYNEEGVLKKTDFTGSAVSEITAGETYAISSNAQEVSVSGKNAVIWMTNEEDGCTFYSSLKLDSGYSEPVELYKNADIIGNYFTATLDSDRNWEIALNGTEANNTEKTSMYFLNKSTIPKLELDSIVINEIDADNNVQPVSYVLKNDSEETITSYTLKIKADNDIVLEKEVACSIAPGETLYAEDEFSVDGINDTASINVQTVAAGQADKTNTVVSKEMNLSDIGIEVVKELNDDSVIFNVIVTNEGRSAQAGNVTLYGDADGTQELTSVSFDEIAPSETTEVSLEFNANDMAFNGEQTAYCMIKAETDVQEADDNNNIYYGAVYMRELNEELFSINSSNVALSGYSYTYNGGVKTPSVKVTDISGKTLSKDKDYTVSYQSGRKYVGAYKVEVKGIGNYSGSVTKTFNINPQGTYITKLSKGSKRFTVKWKKRTTQVTGYQVRYSTSSSMAGAKTTTITKNKTTSKTIKKLKAKKKYYVQVRTYKTVSGKKYYSGWSSRKYVKTR